MKSGIVILIFLIGFAPVYGQKKKDAPVVSSSSSAPVKIVKLGIDTLTNIPAAADPPVLEISECSLAWVENEGFISADEKGYLRFKIKNTGSGDAYNLRLYISEISGIEGLKYNNYKFVARQFKAGEIRTDSISIEGKSNLQDGKAKLELVLSEANGYKSQPATMSLLTRGASRYSLDILNYDINNINERELRVQLTLKNTGSYILKDTKISVNSPATVYVKGDSVKYMSMLKPDESGELDFVFVKNQYWNEARKDLFRINIEDSNGYPIGMQRLIARIPNNSDSSSGNADGAFTATVQSDVDIIPYLPDKETKNAHTYALIIGNQKYISNQEVPNAENDARVFSSYCARLLNIPKENITLMTNATGNQMKEGLRILARNATYDAGGKANLIVYYSGHGVMARDKSSKTDSDYDQYLLPVDVSGADASLSISRKDIYAALNDVPFNRASLFLDACNVPINRAIIKEAKYEWKGNVFVFASSTSNQSSITYQEKKHGLFTYFLLKNIQEKKGNINYRDLTEQVIENVKRISDSMSNNQQTPEVIVSPQAGESWKKWKLSE